MNTAQKIQHQLETIVAAYDADVTIELDVPDELEHGDYTTTVAFELGNTIGENPRDVAQDIVEQFEETDYVERIEVAGPGYINFYLDRTQRGQHILQNVEHISFEPVGEKVVVEHTSPNPNKPLHMGTMRCAILGDTIARVGDFIGYNVEVQNLINDLGRQSATTVYAYRNFLDELDEEDKEKKADFWVGILYSKAAQYLETEGSIGDVDQIIRDIEDGGNETAELKDDLVEQSVRGQLETAFRSNITYDALIFERDIIASNLYEEGLEQIKSMDRVYKAENREDKGCIVLDISDFEDELGELQKPYKILIRSDGTATYVAKDIVLTLWKFGMLETSMRFHEFVDQPNSEPLWSSGGDTEKAFGDADKVINVIGAEQKYPQKIIKYSLKALGLDEAADNFDHMHFKFVYLPGRVAYSGRKGNWVGKHGDAVLDRAYELALDEVEERHDDLSQDEMEDIAEQVAIAAVRYFLLKFTREKDIDFSFEKALDWEGDSGPYLLYSTARAQSILNKADMEPQFTTYEDDVEYELVQALDEFSTVVQETFESEEPAKLAHYLKSLAETFNTFYHHAPVLAADTEELQASRLAIVDGFVTVMEQGLDLLGIEPLEEM